MKYALTAAILLSLLTAPSANAQAWIPDVIAQEIGRDALERAGGVGADRCMRGQAPPPSEQRMTAIRESATASMTRYLTLAATSESSDVSAVFSNHRSRSWGRHSLAGVAWGAVESVNDQLARTPGAVLGEAQAILLAGDGSTAAGQWVVRDDQGQTIGHYRGVFRRERRDWRLLHLEVFGIDVSPTPLQPYCHIVGDIHWAVVAADAAPSAPSVQKVLPTE